MIRQAVQTLTGRGATVEDPTVIEDVYLMDESPQDAQTVPLEEGPVNNQNDLSQLQATVDRLSQTVEKQFSEKDRYIGRLEREAQLKQAGQYGPAAEREPQVDPDPVLDADTAALFAEKYPEKPEEALMALAEHLDTRSKRRVDERSAQDQQVQQATARLQAIEANVLRQVDLAVRNLGPAATELVGDFLNIYRGGQGTAHDYGQTWLGSSIGGDTSLGESTQGVYRLIELELYRRQATATEPSPVAYEQPAPVAPTQGIARPAAPSRNVAAPTTGAEDDISVEERIGQAIVNANHGDEAGMQQLFRG